MFFGGFESLHIDFFCYYLISHNDEKRFEKYEKHVFCSCRCLHHPSPVAVFQSIDSTADPWISQRLDRSDAAPSVCVTVLPISALYSVDLRLKHVCNGAVFTARSSSSSCHVNQLDEQGRG